MGSRKSLFLVVVREYFLFFFFRLASLIDMNNDAYEIGAPIQHLHQAIIVTITAIPAPTRLVRATCYVLGCFL